MKKNYAISPQIINTTEISNEPWGVKIVLLTLQTHTSKQMG
ncbi:MULTISPECIES: hypothetical protein [Photorhabdus]|nr:MULTISPECIES: hypothetical protein [Photorhabdus]